jgi:hypothetical protein
MVLEEAVLIAEISEAGGLEAQVSGRRLCQCLGISREAARRALAELVDGGLLVRHPVERDQRGRFVDGGYVLLPPAGLSVVGSPDSALPATERRAVRRDATVTDAAGNASAVSAGQASLFAADAEEDGGGPLGSEGAPSDSREFFRAKDRDGCKVVHRVHELAPVVRSAGPLSRRAEGSTSC